MNKSSATEHEEHKNGKRGHEVMDDAAAQITKIKKASASIGDELAAYVKKQPVAAVGMAVGAGFVLGSIFGSKLGRLALLAGAGYVAQDLIEGALGEGGVRKLVVDELSKLAKTDRSAT